jgi:YggT family protein
VSQAREIIVIFINILSWLIFVRVILSWIPIGRNSPLVRLVYEVTEPLLAPFRKILPRGSMPVDFSPLIAYFVLQIIRSFIIRMP